MAKWLRDLWWLNERESRPSEAWPASCPQISRRTKLSGDKLKAPMRSNFILHMFFIFLLCLGLSFVIPLVHISNLDALITSATFLFSIIYGFEISMVIANFSQLKTQLAVENAGLLSLFHLAGMVGGETGREVQKRVEQYLMAAIDYPLAEHFRADKQFFAMFEPMRKMQNIEGQERGRAVQYLNEALYYLPQARNQVAEVAPRFVDRSVWSMLLVLGTILAGLIFVGHGPDIFSQITAAIFATSVICALVLLDEIDSNKVEEARVEYEMFNESLVSIGAMRYYPESAIKEGIIKPGRNVSYRMGVFPRYPSRTDRKIVVVGKKPVVRRVAKKTVRISKKKPKTSEIKS
jgi:hypothetical protein